MRAVISIAYFGLLRCGEFTTHNNQFDPEINLCYGDVSIDGNEAKLILKGSKTDPFRFGVSIPFYKQESMLCPVTALHRFMRQRSKFAMDPRLPLFLFEDFTHLTRKTFLYMLQSTCESSGVNAAGYHGHSFRIGGATLCAAMGIEDHLIQSLGRWSSNCYKTYVHVSTSSIKDAQRKMSGMK